jgi:hypothetical protein
MGVLDGVANDDHVLILLSCQFREPLGGYGHQIYPGHHLLLDRDQLFTHIAKPLVVVEAVIYF